MKSEYLSIKITRVRTRPLWSPVDCSLYEAQISTSIEFFSVS